MNTEEHPCPCCRDATFTHRDFLLDHLQEWHTPAEVYVAVGESNV